MNHKEYIQRLLQDGNLKKAIEELLRGTANDNDLNGDIVLLSSRFNSNERERRMGTASNEDYKRESARITYALTSYLEDYRPPQGIEFDASKYTNNDDNNGITPDDNRPKLFISYRHADKTDAQRVKKFLEDNGIAVIIDSTHLKAGGNIREFIIKSIKESDATLSLVSKRSLSSPWVSMESELTLNHEMWSEGSKFIACSLDAEFFQTGFVNDQLKSIIEKIKSFESEKTERKSISDMLDTSDLDGEIKRHKAFMQDLPKIITRLKEHLTVDISGDQFKTGMQLVVNTLKKS